MFSIPEQFSAASKSNLEAQIALFTNLSNKAFEGVEKIIDLNMNVAKASLEESTAAASKLFAAKDPQEFFALTAAQAQPSAEKAIAYGRHLAGITTAASADFTKAAESQIAESQAKIVALIDELSKNAPAGSENAVAMLKTALGNASAGYEQLTKGSKHVAETIEANVTAAVSQFQKTAAAAKPAAKSKK
jgi:phasin family protein